MKYRWLCLCLLTALGCGRTRPPATLAAFSRTGGRRPERISGPLLGGTTIRCEADSFEALVAKAKPTCTWNGQDMLWVKRDEKGRPSFTLDRAYLCRTKAGLEKWVLVTLGRGRALFGQFGGGYTHGTFSLSQAIPMHDTGSGNYAVVESQGPGGHMLYRLGWQALPTGGSGHHQNNRTIFLLKGPQGSWRIVGEGRIEGSWKSGYPVSCGTGAKYRVNWTPQGSSPLRIDLTVWNRTCEVGEEPMGALDLLVRRDGTLVSTPSLGIRWTSGEYITPKRGDTLGRIAERLAWWRPSFRPKEGYRHLLAEVWLELLQQRNPDLPEGRLPQSARVSVPNIRSFTSALKLRQARKAGVYQFVESRRGLKSVWGVDIQLDRLAFRPAIKAEHIKLVEGKYGRDLKKIMTWTVSRDGKRLRIRFKPGMGDFGTGNGLTVHINSAALVKNTGVNPRMEWSIDTDIH
jgi:hypothetical protein